MPLSKECPSFRQPFTTQYPVSSSLREREREREANLVCTYKVLVPEVGKIIANKRPTG